MQGTQGAVAKKDVENGDFGVYLIAQSTAPACYQQAQALFIKREKIEVQIGKSLDEVQAALATGWSGLVVSVVEKKEDLLALFQFIATHKDEIAQGDRFKIIVFNRITHAQVPALLLTQGCSEVFEEDKVSAKTLVHKGKRYLSLIRSVRKGVLEEPTETRGVDESSSPASGEVLIQSPFEHPSDCWLLRQKGDARRVLGSWIVELMGPGPRVGQWVPHFDDEEGPAWRWEPRNEKSPFFPSRGRWIFRGREPEFAPEFNRWRFVSYWPALFFEENGEVVFERFSSDRPNRLSILQNSKVAVSHLPLMEETFENQQGSQAKLIEDLIEEGLRSSLSFEKVRRTTWEKDQMATDEDLHNPFMDVALFEKEDSELLGEWSQGEAAFAPIGVKAYFKGEPAYLLEQKTPVGVRVDLPDGKLKVGDKVALDVVWVTGDHQAQYSLRGKVEELLHSAGVPGRWIASLLLEENERDSAKEIYQVVQQRQQDINSFLRRARGL